MCLLVQDNVIRHICAGLYKLEWTSSNLNLTIGSGLITERSRSSQARLSKIASTVFLYHVRTCAMHECGPSSSSVPAKKGTDVIPSPCPFSLFPIHFCNLCILACLFMQRAVPTSPGEHIP